MRTLCKKALALCVVFALALTCFVGTLSVSAADPYDATLTVADVDVNFGDTTATAVLHIAVAAPGINEAIINIDSTIGTIDAEPALDLETLVVDGGGDAYVDVVGDDFSKLFLSARRDPAVTELNGILTADITVVFTLKDGVKPGTYPINIVTEGVKAADKNETVVNLVYATAGNFIVACDHANATEDVTTAPTCTEPGVKTITCACGYTTTEPVDALGHAEELTYTSKEDGTHAVDCPNCEVAFDAEDCVDNDANNICDKCGYAFPVEPEHEHHIVWESIGDGKHTSKCDAEGCDDTFVPATEDCADENADNTCDKCGYDMTPEVQEPVYDATLAFKGKTALFESDYSLMYYVPVKLGTSWYIEVSREVYNKNTRLEDKKVTLTVDDVYSTTKPGDGNEYYLVALRGIATKEVANEIVAVLHNNIDGVDYYGAELSYNLVDYAVARMAKNIAKEVKYLQAFLNYAAACQVKFGYNTTDLANSVLSEEAKVVTLNGEVTQDSDVKEYEVLEGATATLNGFAPSYEDKMTLGTICKVPDNYVDAGLKIRYSYVNSAGVTKNDYVSLADSKEYSIAGYRLVMFTGLAIKEVRTPVLVTVVDANNNPISNTRQYSFEAYAAKQSETSQDYAPARAMVAFGDWFKVYKDN